MCLMESFHQRYGLSKITYEDMIFWVRQQKLNYWVWNDKSILYRAFQEKFGYTNFYPDILQTMCSHLIEEVESGN